MSGYPRSWRKLIGRGPEVSVRATHQVFTADRVLITLSLGVLQRQEPRFVPDLPEGKLEAISKLGMGVINKCYLRFPHAFWPDDVDWLGYIPEHHGAWTEWVSLQRAMQWPVLLGYNAADHGRDMEAWTDEMIVSSAMATLKTIFGNHIPQPVDHQITRWVPV